MTVDLFRVRGSYRDPKGYVLSSEDRIFRVVTAAGRDHYGFLKPLIPEAVKAGFLIATWEADLDLRPLDIDADDMLLEHTRIPYVSYPYEWGFAALRAAALHHLDFQLWLLQRGATLSDASAYNIQFLGGKPLFIDVLSIIPYRAGSHWAGYRQFCEQFLNPLLLRARRGIAHNAWYRGAMEGITTEDLAATLSLRDKFSLNVLAHVVLHARLQRGSRADPGAAVGRVRKGRGLSTPALHGMLTNLRNWVARLAPKGGGLSTWADYAGHNTYQPEEARQKAAVVADFVKAHAPRRVMDLGCNSGDYSVTALESGAGCVIGFDFDHTAVDRAFGRAQSLGLPFLPLWLDAANPSPDQGWYQGERDGFAKRANADAVLALAFEHHLAIGRNIPLDQVVAWLVGLAPRGLIEFVPKSDPTIQMMLALREDVFPHYDEVGFRDAVNRVAKVVASTPVSGSGRVIYEYQR